MPTKLKFNRRHLVLGLLTLPITYPVAIAATLSGAEYFIDPTPWLVPHVTGTQPCDGGPSVGSGTPIPPTDGTWNAVAEAVRLAGIVPTGLTPGIHDICIRFKDSAGRWGPAQFAHFTLLNGQGLAGCEYYLDTDPGPGHGQPFPTADGTFNTNAENLRSAAIATTGLSAGVHVIGARCRDSFSHWGATVMTNVNLVVAAASDFTLTAMTIPVAPVANGTFSAVVTVKNQGAGAADGGTLRLWANQPAAQVCAATGGDKTMVVGTMAAGASKNLTFTGINAGAGGLKTLRAFVDAACVRAETNETNNQRTLSYRVAGRQADLVVTNMVVTPATPAVNGNFTLTVTVKNQGTAADVGGYVDVWTNQTTTQTCGASGTAWADVGSLSVGATKILNFILPAGTAGTKTARTFVDSWCETSELNEVNNQMVKTYTVQ